MTTLAKTKSEQSVDFAQRLFPAQNTIGVTSELNTIKRRQATRVPFAQNKTFKPKDHLQHHLQCCPTLQKVVNQSEPSATQFFLLEDIKQSEPSAMKEYFLPAQNMDQS